MGAMAHFALLKNYFSQYGWLYLIPAAFAIFSFAVFGINKNREPKTSGIFGTAEFADKTAFAEMNAYDESGSLFGKDEKGNYLYYPLCNRTIIAQPDGGKSTGVVTPALLTENRPLFVNDPKGELWAVAGRHRHLAFNRESVVLDPFNITRKGKFIENKPASLINKVYTFNPLDLLGEDPLMYDRTLESLVESLISPSKDGNSTTEHFNEASKTILKGLIEWVSKKEPPHKRNLITVNHNLNLETDKLNPIIDSMLASKFYHAKKAGAVLKNQSKGEHRDSLMTTVSRHLNWLDDINMREFVAQSNFDLKDFLKGNMDVYVVLPSDQSSAKKFVRAVLASLYNIFIQADPEDRPDKKTLFIFDEQGQLGYFPDIEKMIAELRNCGLIIWSIFQDIGQINQYSKPGLFTGAPLKQFFNIDDIETMEWIQKLGGSRTIYTGSTSKSHSSGKQSSTNQSESEQETRTELIHTNEIREMNSDRQFVFIRSAKPILCEKIPYFKQRRFDGQYDKNPVDIKKH
jgi:type IV secretion system protein VirD4